MQPISPKIQLYLTNSMLNSANKLGRKAHKVSKLAEGLTKNPAFVEKHDKLLKDVTKSAIPAILTLPIPGLHQVCSTMATVKLGQLVKHDSKQLALKFASEKIQNAANLIKLTAIAFLSKTSKL